MTTSNDLAAMRGTLDKHLYWTPFYEGGTREVRLARRATVTVYLPHTFAESEAQPGLCRICTFPQADAACAVPS